MHQSGRAGDEAKKGKSPVKSGRVGITVNVKIKTLYEILTVVHACRPEGIQE